MVFSRFKKVGPRKFYTTTTKFTRYPNRSASMQPLEEDPEISELLGETKPSKKCVQFKVVGNDKESVLRNRKRKNKEHYDQSKKNGQESDTKKQKTGSSGKTNSMLERAKLKLKERYDEEQSKKNDRIIAIIDKDMSKKKSNRHIIEKRKPIDIEKEKTKLEAFTKVMCVPITLKQ